MCLFHISYIPFQACDALINAEIASVPRPNAMQTRPILRNPASLDILEVMRGMG